MSHWWFQLSSSSHSKKAPPAEGWTHCALWTRNIIKAKELGESQFTGVQKSVPTPWNMEPLPVEEATILYKNHSVLHIFKASDTEFWDACEVACDRNTSEMTQKNATNAATIKLLFWSELFSWHALISHPSIVVGPLCFNINERMVRISQKNPVWYDPLSFRFLSIFLCLLNSVLSTLAWWVQPAEQWLKN